MANIDGKNLLSNFFPNCEGWLSRACLREISVYMNMLKIIKNSIMFEGSPKQIVEGSEEEGVSSTPANI